VPACVHACTCVCVRAISSACACALHLYERWCVCVGTTWANSTADGPALPSCYLPLRAPCQRGKSLASWRTNALPFPPHPSGSWRSCSALRGSRRTTSSRPSRRAASCSIMARSMRWGLGWGWTSCCDVRQTQLGYATMVRLNEVQP